MNTEHLFLMNQEDEGIKKVADLLNTEGSAALICTPEGTHFVFANTHGEMGLNLFKAIFCNAILAEHTPLELQRAMFDWCLQNLDEFDHILFDDVIERLKQKLGGQGNATD